MSSEWLRYWRCRRPAKWLACLLWPMVGHLVKIRADGVAYCQRCPWRDDWLARPVDWRSEHETAP